MADPQTDAKIVEALKAMPTRDNSDIARELGTTRVRVRYIRGALGIPPVRRGGPARFESLRDAIQSRIVEDGGHHEWTGPRHSQFGTPLVTSGGRHLTVARWVFVDHFGHEPSGYVKATCDRPNCVRGEHLADAPMRKGGTS